MRFEIDLSAVQSLKPVPDGTYIVRIEKCEAKTSKNDKPKLTFTSEILEPSEIKETNPRFWWDVSLSSGALWHLKDLYDAVGVGYDSTGIDTNDLLGREVGIVVTLEEYEGTMRNYVKSFVPVAQTSPKLKAKSASASAQG